MSAAIAGIAGGLRAGSRTRALLRAAAGHIPPGLRLTIWDGLARVPPFSQDLEAATAPGAVAELRQLIRAADAVLIVTPEYNGPVPGQFGPADPGFAPCRQHHPAHRRGESGAGRALACAGSNLRRLFPGRESRACTGTTPPA